MKDNEIKEEITEEMKEETKDPAGTAKKPGKVATVILCVLFLIGTVIIAASIWFRATFGVGFKELLYTLFFAPLAGSDSGIFWNAFFWCVPFVLVVFIIYLIAFLKSRSFLAKHPLPKKSKENDSSDGEMAEKKKEKKERTKLEKKQHRSKFIRALCVVLSIVLFFGSFVCAFFSLDIYPYLKSNSETTRIYEEEYIKPDISKITADGKTKNLIYIYLESMETTYSSTEVGGRQEINYMPGMTELAKENLTFSDKSGGLLGGFHNPDGTVWTMAAILATTSGIPFSFPVGRNKMSKHTTFAPGLTNLGDILEEKGYEQEFLCGSDAVFGGRKNYFVQHGNYKIFDLFSAREKGYIPEDYKVWWGYEDEYLYQIAKDELTELASHDVPFNFTMLTVDTHHVDGYVCNLCKDTYESTTANVVNCADRQLTDFVDWIKEQDFFEDTVVIITGDHPRMDTNLVEDVDYYDRTIYNCIINTDTVPEGETENRTYTPMDMFPTILEAIGFDVEGRRLGLGTSLFSGQPTIPERMAEEIAAEHSKEGEELTLEESRRLGYDKFSAEIAKHSDYYDIFSKAPESK